MSFVSQAVGFLTLRNGLHVHFLPAFALVGVQNLSGSEILAFARNSYSILHCTVLINVLVHTNLFLFNNNTGVRRSF